MSSQRAQAARISPEEIATLSHAYSEASRALIHGHDSSARAFPAVDGELNDQVALALHYLERLPNNSLRDVLSGILMNVHQEWFCINSDAQISLASY